MYEVAHTFWTTGIDGKWGWNRRQSGESWSVLRINVYATGLPLTYLDCHREAFPVNFTDEHLRFGIVTDWNLAPRKSNTLSVRETVVGLDAEFHEWKLGVLWKCRQILNDAVFPVTVVVSAVE